MGGAAIVLSYDRLEVDRNRVAAKDLNWLIRKTIKGDQTGMVGINNNCGFNIKFYFNKKRPRSVFELASLLQQVDVVDSSDNSQPPTKTASAPSTSTAAAADASSQSTAAPCSAASHPLPTFTRLNPIPGYADKRPVAHKCRNRASPASWGSSHSSQVSLNNSRTSRYQTRQRSSNHSQSDSRARPGNHFTLASR